MNHLRVLRITNILFIFIGYQLHWFVAKNKRYQLSLWGIIQCAVWTLCYVICFQEHFEPSLALQLLHSVSPFLRSLVRLQLWLCCMAFVLGLYETAHVVRAANGFVAQLPGVFARRCQRQEVVAYALFFATPLLGIGYVAYIAYEMDFRLPPVEYLLIGGALFLPHFINAGAIKLYSIYSWLAYTQLSSLNEDIGDPLTPALPAAVNLSGATGNCALAHCQSDLQVLVARFEDFSQSIRRPLGLLLVLNGNCLLAGAYMWVYLGHSWYMLFEEHMQRVLYAANSAIFVLIASDYLCMLLTQFALHRECATFVQNLSTALVRRQSMAKATRVLLKDMRAILQNAFQFKLLGAWHITILNFVQLHLFLLLTIAFTVACHYFKDEMYGINVILDSANDDE